MCSEAALPQDHTPQFPRPSRSGGVAEGGDTHSGTTGHSHHPHARQCGEEVKHFPAMNLLALFQNLMINYLLWLS